MTKSNQFLLSVATVNRIKRQPWEKEKNLENIATVSSDTLHTQLNIRELWFLVISVHWLDDG